MQNKVLHKVLKISSYVLIGLVVLLAFAMVGVRIFGVDVYFVKSGSMEPKYPTGSLLYITDVDPDRLDVDDVITFQLTDTMTATHRIVELVPDEDDSTIIRFRTKGDNNKVIDTSLVDKEAVVGKAVFCIPYLGYLAAYIQQPPGLYVAIGAAVVVVCVVLMIDMMTDDKDKTSKTVMDKKENNT